MGSKGSKGSKGPKGSKGSKKGSSLKRQLSALERLQAMKPKARVKYIDEQLEIERARLAFLSDSKFDSVLVHIPQEGECFGVAGAAYKPVFTAALAQTIPKSQLAKDDLYGKASRGVARPRGRRTRTRS